MKSLTMNSSPFARRPPGARSRYAQAGGVKFHEGEPFASRRRRSKLSFQEIREIDVARSLCDVSS